MRTSDHIVFSASILLLLPPLFLLSSFQVQATEGNPDKHYLGKPTTIYQYQSSDGVTSFSGIEPIGLSYTQVRFDCFACRVKPQVSWHNTKLFVTEFSQSINQAALRNNVDSALVRAIIHAESHFQVNAVSKQGAQGLMQLMPDTAQWLGVNNPFIAKQNIQGGVKHLARLVKKYQGNISLASAAYNAGEGAVKKFGGVPPYAETQRYVERVEILHHRYKQYNLQRHPAD